MLDQKSFDNRSQETIENTLLMFYEESILLHSSPTTHDRVRQRPKQQDRSKADLDTADDNWDNLGVGGKCKSSNKLDF